MSDQAIGLFDSGIGGLSVFRELRRQLPQENVIYFADTKHMPYGSRSTTELKQLVFAILDWLVEQSVKLVIMACNTSSAWTLESARTRYTVPILGMIRPTAAALAATASDHLGIIATEATVESGKYPEELRRAGYTGKISSQPCPRLASLVESGASQAALAAAVEQYLQPLREAGVKQLVLACTHYPFAAPQIADYLGDGVELCDPAVSVVARAKQLLESRQLKHSPQGEASCRFYTSGSPHQFAERAALLLGAPLVVKQANFYQSGDRLRVAAE